MITVKDQQFLGRAIELFRLGIENGMGGHSVV